MQRKVQVGADQLRTVGKQLLKGKRFGLLTNPTGITSNFQSTIEICQSLDGAKLSALFACEHGLRNEKQAGVLFEDEMDSIYGVPVYSLYGSRRKPSPESLKELDVLVFDIQDIGVRFYTYLTTLVYVMQACAVHHVGVVVLDRPNPLGGQRIEGGLLQEDCFSMVGAWKMPVITGLTIGEFAKLVNSQLDVPCELQVIPMIGWGRSMEYPDTGLPWIMPSANMPTMDTVRVYGGNCFFEGTNLSEGRGTTKPFELIGAPWLNHDEVCEVMNDLDLPGVHYHPVTFTPTFSKYQGELCNGVMTFVTDKHSFRSVESGLTLLYQIMKLHPDDFSWRGEEDGKPFIDILTGSVDVRKRIAEPHALAEILCEWRNDSNSWELTREPHLMYP